MTSDAGGQTRRACAQRAASRLSGEAVREVYSLSSEAADETAEILAAPHGLRVRCVAGSGLDLPAQDGEISADALRAAADRAWKALEKISRETRPHTALVVTEGPTIQMVVCDILGMPLSSYERIGQDACAANLLLREDYGWVVESVNDDCRLTESPGEAADHS